MAESRRLSLGLTLWAVLIATGGQPAAGQSIFDYYGPILNAANGWSWGEIAPRSLFVIRGGELGPAEAQRASQGETELAGTSVTIASGGINHRAAVVYASAGMVVGVLPAEVPIGDATVSVGYGGRNSAAKPFRVAPRAFGILTQGGRGDGPAVAQNVEGVELRANGFSSAARPGQTMVLWGTGLGSGAAEMEVVVGGKAVRPRYAGPSGCCAGLDQVLFDVPTGVEGCAVPVTARFGGGYGGTNYATISVAQAGGMCADPHLPYPEGRRPSSIYLRGLPGGYLDAVAQFPRPAENRTTPSLGSCIVEGATFPEPLALWAPPRHPAERAGLDAGGRLTVRGPAAVVELAQRSTGVYYDDRPSGVVAWTPGDYVVDNGNGGTDVGPFRATITLPPTRTRWSSKGDPLAYHFLGDGGLTVEWEGGDPGGEYVLISGGNDDGLIAEPSYFYFTCAERADKGRFTVPQLVLEPMRRSGSRSVFVEFRAVSFPRAFQARGLEAGWLAYEFLDALGFVFDRGDDATAGRLKHSR